MLVLPLSVQQDSDQVLPQGWSCLCPCLTPGTSHLTLQRELCIAQATAGGRWPPDFASWTDFAVLQTAETPQGHSWCLILHLGGQGMYPAKGNLQLSVLSNDRWSRGKACGAPMHPPTCQLSELLGVEMRWCCSTRLCCEQNVFFRQNSEKKIQHMVPGRHHYQTTQGERLRTCFIRKKIRKLFNLAIL